MPPPKTPKHASSPSSWGRRLRWLLLPLLLLALLVGVVGYRTGIRRPKQVANALVQLWSFVVPPWRTYRPGQAVPELSGMVASRRHFPLLYGIGDSGTGNFLYGAQLRRAADGVEIVGAQQWQISGAKNRDWEALAIDDQGRLIIADIGDNLHLHDDVRFYRVPEPGPGPDDEFLQPRQLQATGATVLNFPSRGPDGVDDGPVDAEACFWAAGRVYLLTKRRHANRTALYSFPDSFFRDPSHISSIHQPPSLRYEAAFDLHPSDFTQGVLVTGADLSPDGRRLAMLTYDAVYLFEVDPKNQHPINFSAPLALVRFADQEASQREALVWHGAFLVAAAEDGSADRLRLRADQRSLSLESRPARQPPQIEATMPGHGG